MDYSDYGQIEIYNKIFSDADECSTRGNIKECIENKTSYTVLFNNYEIPVMVGSKFDKSDNPFKVKGFFVINGICKAINNVKLDIKTKYRKTECQLNDKSKIKIVDMFNYTITKDNKVSKWNLPINYEDIIEKSEFKTELASHFDIIKTLTKKDLSIVIKKEIDLMNICYMFETWLGLRKEEIIEHRLLTAGEIFKICISQNQNIINSFITNTWKINYRTFNSISEDMKHYNIYSDYEAIRRITIMRNRDLVGEDERIVKMEERYKICPVQTSDGSICGTVRYLCRDSRLMDYTQKIEIEEGDDIHLYYNSLYRGKTTYKEIDRLRDMNIIICIRDKICYAFCNYGIILPGNTDVSYTTSLIEYRYHNPPIRSMFASNMIKQSIQLEKRDINNLIPMTKSLINEVDKIIVGIMPWFGYNIEDGVVISDKLSKKYKYRKTRVYNELGILIDLYVKLGKNVTKGDILFKIFNGEEIRTTSCIYAEDDGKVNRIEIHDNRVKVVISEIKRLKVGDKMTSIHGQKGVISLILKDEEMPYYIDENEKIYLELLINPHAFPTRMTMGQILEMGNEEKYLYVKDEKIKNKIIVGKCQYFALRHQVDDKIQYRNGGNYDVINKQPVRGRKNEGGLRFGQMERDILIGLNCFNTLNEFWSIDRNYIEICKKTGIINGKCCKERIDVSQAFIICLSYVRALGYDIKILDGKYLICKLDLDILDKCKSLKFGDVDPKMVKRYDKMVVLPLCLRNNRLNGLYIKNIKYGEKEKEIEKETRKLLSNKKGAFHKYVEGHAVNKCMRSVITPNPNIDIDTVYVPIEANIGCRYGLLNRQPSLNAKSLKLVKLKVHNNKTISFNPLLCKSFNADFDGDEMNIYGISNEESIKELKEKLFKNSDKTQDYILGDLKDVTMDGLTANKEGIKYMIEQGSKGKEFNYNSIYNSINDDIKDNYYGGISKDNWYKLSILARKDIISIAINTPSAGSLLSLCIQRLI